MYQYADMFGLTEKSGVEIAEATPEISDIDPARSAIGQGTNSNISGGLCRMVRRISEGDSRGNGDFRLFVRRERRNRQNQDLIMRYSYVMRLTNKCMASQYS